MKTAKRFVLFFFFVICFFAFGDVYAEDEIGKCAYRIPVPNAKGEIRMDTIEINVWKNGNDVTFNVLNDTTLHTNPVNGWIGVSKKSSAGQYLNKDKFIDSTTNTITCPANIYSKIEFFGDNVHGLVYYRFHHISDDPSHSGLSFVSGSFNYLQEGTIDFNLTSLPNDKNFDKLKDEIKKNQCSELREEHVKYIREVNQTLTNYKAKLSTSFNNLKSLNKIGASMSVNGKNAESLIYEISDYLDADVRNQMNSIVASLKTNDCDIAEVQTYQNIYDEIVELENDLLEFLKEHPDIVNDIEKTDQTVKNTSNKRPITFSPIGQEIVGCDFIDSEIWSEIRKVLTWIQIAVPILILVLGSVDFGKAVLSEDQDALKKATSNFVKRLIIGVAIFLVPIILDVLLNFVELPEVQGSLCKDQIGL